MSSPPSLPLPTSLGARFQVEEALPETPFERTFRARDVVLQREVLLKLPARAAYDGWTAPVKERLLREARSLAKIRHDGIAPIHHVEDTPEGPLLVLDLPQGELLADRLQHGPLPRDEVIALGIQLGEALAAVHQQGVVHRAVGPATIRLLANGKMQLGSFTFAKEFGGARGTSLVHVRGAAATAPRASHLPEYPAPEQAAGQTADPRADVFALGCTLYRCLTGRDPFPLGTEHAEMPDLRTLRKDVDRPLAEVIRKCMLFAKTARHATAQEVVAALRALGANGAAAGGARRWRAVGLVGACALVLGAWVVRDSWAGEPKDRGNGEPGAAPLSGYGRTYKPGYDRLRGLFIAIGEAYPGGKQWCKLPNPVREVDEVIAQLQANDAMWKAEGAVVRLPDAEATAARIREELKRLANDAGEDDGVLVYFSGHGARDGHSFGLCAQDVQGDVASGTGYLRREELLTFADNCKAKHVLVVLDCCHSGAVFDLAPSRGRDPEEPAQLPPGDHLRSKFSREFLCSAAANQAASDGTGGMSPFCKQLLAQLRQPAGQRRYLAGRYLGSRVAEAMEQGGARMGAMQMPQWKQMAEQEGSFVFLLAPGK